MHGDFHLGQTLHTPTGWKIIDFEGEPAKTIERRPPTPSGETSPACCASFDYAAASVEGPHSAAWAAECRTAFLRAYGRRVDCGRCQHVARVRGRQGHLRGRLRDAESAGLVGIPLRAVAALASDNRDSGSDPPPTVGQQSGAPGEASPPREHPEPASLPKHAELVSPTENRSKHSCHTIRAAV